ncbi:hypothetical protein D3C71_1958600 [compost metagenome]
MFRQKLGEAGRGVDRRIGESDLSVTLAVEIVGAEVPQRTALELVLKLGEDIRRSGAASIPVSACIGGAGHIEQGTVSIGRQTTGIASVTFLPCPAERQRGPVGDVEIECPI